jgi:hypothetical protein
VLVISDIISQNYITFSMIPLSPLIYKTTGFTTGLNTNTDLESIKTKAISLLLLLIKLVFLIFEHFYEFIGIMNGPNKSCLAILFCLVFLLDFLVSHDI